MSDHRKSIHQLKQEYDEDFSLHGKPFIHIGTGEDYQLLFCAFGEVTNEKLAVYCLSAMTWMKYVMPFEDFKEKFKQGRSTDLAESEKQ